MAYADIPRRRMSAATGLYSTAQQLSMTLGVSIGAAVLQASMALAGRARPVPADFTVALLTVAFCALLAAPVPLVLAPDAGEELSGHHAD